MTDLVVRKIRWEFDETVPFMWQPANPNFAIFCNVFTFIAVPFERYIIKALRQAQDRFDASPDIAAEAEAFLRQEGQHASAHRKHMTALVTQYPELERAYEEATSAFDKLIEEHPVEFHAAYIANLEATFTPLFKVFLGNRDALFGGSDQRVASLMMWHFVEEIEHRSSGLILYRHLTPDAWYRVKRIPDTFKHVGDLCRYRTVDLVDDQFGVPKDRVERSAEFVAHVGQELRFVQAGDLQLVALPLDLPEQACVLDGQCRLRCECLQQLHDLMRKLSGSPSRNGETAEDATLSQQRHSQQRMKARPLTHLLEQRATVIGFHA